MIAPIAIEQVQAAQRLAAIDPAREACGLLVGRGAIVDAVVACRNVADDPHTAFEIDPARLVAAHRAARAGGPAVLGCWHSHPNGSAMPSLTDAAAAQPGQLWLIVTAADARLFRFELNGFVELSIGSAARPPCLADDPPP